MKKVLFAALAFCGISALSAQTTAMDWTRTECGSSTQHHLFAELDSGYVIVIDFVMMNCPSCVTATNSLTTIIAPYKESHPGKLKFYSVGFNNFTTCDQMRPWMIGNRFTHQAFEKGADETSYYGGIGMPTIVVLGGVTAHKVYYNNFGYSSSEDPNIKAALDIALAESIVSAIPDHSVSVGPLSVFPNPSSGEINVNLSGYKLTHLIIRDLSGQVIYRKDLISVDHETLINIPSGALPPGIFFLAAYDGIRLVAINKVVIE